MHKTRQKTRRKEQVHAVFFRSIGLASTSELCKLDGESMPRLYEQTLSRRPAANRVNVRLAKVKPCCSACKSQPLSQTYRAVAAAVVVFARTGGPDSTPQGQSEAASQQQSLLWLVPVAKDGDELSRSEACVACLFCYAAERQAFQTLSGRFLGDVPFHRSAGRIARPSRCPFQKELSFVTSPKTGR